MLYLGIDHGDRKIGLALSDENGMFADALKVVPNNRILFEVLQDIILEHKVEAIVLGISYNSQKRPTAQTKKILEFEGILKDKFGLPVETWDESYSSQISEKGLTQKQKKKADSLAAQIILQGFLDFKRTKI